MGSMTILKVLRVYRDQSQLCTMDLQDTEATALELLSSEPNAVALQPLLKTHSTRLTKLRISNAKLSSPFWTSSAFELLLSHGNLSRIRYIELECSSVRNYILNGLLSMLNHSSFPMTLARFSIKVDVPWEKPKFCEDIAQLITTSARWLTEVQVEVHQPAVWKNVLLSKSTLDDSVFKTFDNRAARYKGQMISGFYTKQN
ncbi:hypothetical protein BGX29_011842 [Mortierella sp. GBA35]|nr:hypothetical protein BGX29_011842 [Mortierella sp. GBA35]